MCGMRLTLLMLALVLISGCTGSRSAELMPYPDAHPYAAVVTLDTEVAGSEELAGVAEVLRELGMNATFFVVAGYYSSKEEALEPLQAFEVASMGWNQREWLNASAGERREQVRRAHEWFEERGFRVRGFRAPYYNTSGEVLQVLSSLGYLYDSSFYYGIKPYRIDGILEIPPSTNYDIFWDREKLRIAGMAAYLTLESAEREGGVFVFTTHAATAYRSREEFRRFLMYLRDSGAWVVSAGELAEWYSAREGLEVEVEGDEVVLRNRGDTPVEGATVEVRGASEAEGARYTVVRGDTLYVVFPEVQPGGERRVRVVWR